MEYVDFDNPKPGTRNYASEYEMAQVNDVEFMIAFLERNHFKNIRRLEDGSWVGVIRLAYSWAVCSDIMITTIYAYRWCFKTENAAVTFIESMVHFDDIPEDRGMLVGHRYLTEPRVNRIDEYNSPRW